jgi:hypothetical protein
VCMICAVPVRVRCIKDAIHVGTVDYERTSPARVILCSWMMCRQMNVALWLKFLIVAVKSQSVYASCI